MLGSGITHYQGIAGHTLPTTATVALQLMVLYFVSVDKELR
jgi:hypothetical protein